MFVSVIDRTSMICLVLICLWRVASLASLHGEMVLCFLLLKKETGWC